MVKNYKNEPIRYEDASLWEAELKDWLPRKIFDAHVHLGPADVIGETPIAQSGDLKYYRVLLYDEMKQAYATYYSGITVAGYYAFGFPFRETNIRKANQYIIDLSLKHNDVYGFLLVDPYDIKNTINTYYEARTKGAGIYGMKPYYDLLQKSPEKSGVLVTTMDELVPVDLIEFMNDEGLILMLHTCSVGMGDRSVRDFVYKMACKYSKVKIILAHFGRYYLIEQFLDFISSDVMDLPNIYLEMSNSTDIILYEKVLINNEWCKRILFGSDMPYGMNKFGHMRFCDTYLVIKVLKDVMDNLKYETKKETILKEDIFYNNAISLLTHFCT